MVLRDFISGRKSKTKPGFQNIITEFCEYFWRTEVYQTWTELRSISSVYISKEEFLSLFQGLFIVFTDTVVNVYKVHIYFSEKGKSYCGVSNVTFFISQSLKTSKLLSPSAWALLPFVQHSFKQVFRFYIYCDEE